VPLTPEEFYGRRGSLESAVLTFLKENDFAYSAEELVLELKAYAVHASLQAVEAALEALLQRERLEISQPGTRPIYYKYDRRLGFRPPRR